MRADVLGDSACRGGYALASDRSFWVTVAWVWGVHDPSETLGAGASCETSDGPNP